MRGAPLPDFFGGMERGRRAESADATEPDVKHHDRARTLTVTAGVRPGLVNH